MKFKKLMKHGNDALKKTSEFMKTEAGQALEGAALTALETLILKWVQDNHHLTEEQKDVVADKIDHEFDQLHTPLTNPQITTFASNIAPLLTGVHNEELGKVTQDIIDAMTGTTTPEELLRLTHDLADLANLDEKVAGLGDTIFHVAALADGATSEELLAVVQDISAMKVSGDHDHHDHPDTHHNS
ncbi:MAG: hypothetical protein KA998_02650 [Rickettsiaceae bacterium]|nr:hypothetical protein [Rickettsiaceae bacterium]